MIQNLERQVVQLPGKNGQYPELRIGDLAEFSLRGPCVVHGIRGEQHQVVTDMDTFVRKVMRIRPDADDLDVSYSLYQAAWGLEHTLYLIDDDGQRQTYPIPEAYKGPIYSATSLLGIVADLSEGHPTISQGLMESREGPHRTPPGQAWQTRIDPEQISVITRYGSISIEPSCKG